MAAAGSRRALHAERQLRVEGIVRAARASRAGHVRVRYRHRTVKQVKLEVAKLMDLMRLVPY